MSAIKKDLEGYRSLEIDDLADEYYYYERQSEEKERLCVLWDRERRIDEYEQKRIGRDAYSINSPS